MMRRVAVLALAAALPLAAGAQSTTDPLPGTVVFDGAIASDRRDQYVNARECQDNNDLRVTWEVALGGVTLPAGAEYEILASNRTGCEDTNVANGIVTFTIVARFPATAAQQTRLVPLSDFRAPFTLDCATDKKLYVCARLSGISGTVEDAEGTLEFQTQAPPPPTLAANQVTPADHAIDVDWDSVSGPPAADAYAIYATRVSTPAEVHRLEVRTETKGRVGSDLALEPYDVQVASISVAGNEGEKSNAIQATPISVQDFWERYQAAGGRDSGGCATAGGNGLLAALAGLLVLRGAGRSRR